MGELQRKCIQLESKDQNSVQESALLQETVLKLKLEIKDLKEQILTLKEVNAQLKEGT